jgi:aminoglycoside N3'-acetyltransferase
LASYSFASAVCIQRSPPNKLLLLSADIYAASMVHYSEQRTHVPYRYWKKFSGTVIVNGSLQTRTCRMFIRDLDLNPQLTLKPIETLFRQRGQWWDQPLNYGRISSCRLRNFVRAADELLAADPWALAENHPEGQA